MSKHGGYSNKPKQDHILMRKMTKKKKRIYKTPGGDTDEKIEPYILTEGKEVCSGKAFEKVTLSRDMNKEP